MQGLAAFFQEQSNAIPNAEHLASYRILEIAIQAGIEKGLWKQGDLLPPERKLADACGMSVGTVKRAMLELVHQGVLFRRQGSGTFVASPSFNRQHRRYYLLLQDFGEKEAENAVRLHSIQRVPGVKDINAHLALKPGEELFAVERTFSEDGLTCIISRSYVSAARFPKLDQIPRNRFEQVPFFLLLEDDYNTPTLKTDELYGAIAAGEKEAALLRIEQATPLLQITSLMYTRNDVPFEYRISNCLTAEKRIFRSF